MNSIVARLWAPMRSRVVKEVRGFQRELSSVCVDLSASATLVCATNLHWKPLKVIGRFDSGDESAAGPPHASTIRNAMVSTENQEGCGYRGRRVTEELERSALGEPRRAAAERCAELELGVLIFLLNRRTRNAPSVQRLPRWNLLLGWDTQLLDYLTPPTRCELSRESGATACVVGL